MFFFATHTQKIIYIPNLITHANHASVSCLLNEQCKFREYVCTNALFRHFFPSDLQLKSRELKGTAEPCKYFSFSTVCRTVSDENSENIQVGISCNLNVHLQTATILADVIVLFLEMPFIFLKVWSIYEFYPFWPRNVGRLIWDSKIVKCSIRCLNQQHYSLSNCWLAIKKILLTQKSFFQFTRFYNSLI